MDLLNVLERLVLPRPRNQRSRRQLAPAVGRLEDRQLLATATMTQTATFPNLEQYPNVADQAFLYFSSTMGTLTEVDLVASGSYTTQFYAENTGDFEQPDHGHYQRELVDQPPERATLAVDPFGDRELHGRTV